MDFKEIIALKRQRRFQHEEAKLRNENPQALRDRYLGSDALREKLFQLDTAEEIRKEERQLRLAATEKQKSFLIYLGVVFDHTVTKIKASKLIDEALRKRETQRSNRSA